MREQRLGGEPAGLRFGPDLLTATRVALWYRVPVGGLLVVMAIFLLWRPWFMSPYLLSDAEANDLLIALGQVLVVVLTSVLTAMWTAWESLVRRHEDHSGDSEVYAMLAAGEKVTDAINNELSRRVDVARDEFAQLVLEDRIPNWFSFFERVEAAPKELSKTTMRRAWNECIHACSDLSSVGVNAPGALAARDEAERALRQISEVYRGAWLWFTVVELRQNVWALLDKGTWLVSIIGWASLLCFIGDPVLHHTLKDQALIRDSVDIPSGVPGLFSAGVLLFSLLAGSLLIRDLARIFMTPREPFA